MLKSARRAKADSASAGPGNSGGQAQKLGSTASLARGLDGNEGTEGWLPSKTLLKPPNQLQLTEKELNEEFTRILNANNPHAPQNYARYYNKERSYKAIPNTDHIITHFEYEGYMVYHDQDELPGLDSIGRNTTEARADAVQQQQEKETQEQAAGDGDPVEGGTGNAAAAAAAPSRNRFNYSERASQTINHPSRDRFTNTEPPPHRNFSHAVNQWTIFDAYTEDLASKEKASKEKTKAGKTAGHDEGGQASATAASTEAQHEDYKNSAEVSKVARLLERMCNQNTFDEIAQDYKYWEDAGDEFREGKGVLLPLWKFAYEADKKKQVTGIVWNFSRRDLFAVSFGSYDFTKQGPGLIACFSLKNPSYPEFIFPTESGVLCLDFHPNRHSWIAAGMYDGTVAVFDLSKKPELNPVYKLNPNADGKHSDPVWQIQWQADDLDGNANFCTVSSDGRVTQWAILKSELVHTDVIKLRRKVSSLDKLDANGARQDGEVFELSSGTCFDFHAKLPDQFLVGTDEGPIYLCSKAYNSQFLGTYLGHQMSVYSVRFNPHNRNVFISASADWTVRIWETQRPEQAAVMTFDLNASVGDVAWAPYSSTIFAAATADGKVILYDVAESKSDPICDQTVARRAKLTHLQFHPLQPVLLCGDDHGLVASTKLSPNLRKKGKVATRDSLEDKIAKVVTLAMGRPFDGPR